MKKPKREEQKVQSHILIRDVPTKFVTRTIEILLSQPLNNGARQKKNEIYQEIYQRGLDTYKK